uniref:Rabphilin 3A n=1 Tax=Eptatretus burgeri TaxID=7764 RepID=A0A8C4WYR3_EPTBU
MTDAFFGDGTDRWVCPNDRNLTLRAKLNSGWSMKTAQTDRQRRRDTLTVKEQEVIQNVVRKAECIDVVEKRRIGWLVERLENLQRKAIGDGLDHCLLCGEQIGFLRSTGAVCETCQKNVCTKCGVETMSRQHGSLWLCKICSEQREVWKRSGAWFFNKIPDYLTPSKMLSSQSSARHSRASKAEASCPSETGITPMNVNHSYVHGKATSHDSNSESESSLEGDALSDGPKQVKKNQSDSGSSVEGGIRGIAVSGALSGSSSLTDDCPGSGGAAIGHADAQRTTTHNSDDGGAVSPRTPVTMTTNLDVPRVTKSNERETLPKQVVDSDLQEMPPESESDEESVLGMLEFSLLYDPSSSSVLCFLHRAKSLKSMDSNGLADPYVKIHLLPGDSKASKLRSKTVKKTLNPVWNEELSYNGITTEDVLKKMLQLSVYDEDRVGHNEFIGQSRIFLRKLTPLKKKLFKVCLEHQPPTQLENVEEEAEQGRLLLSLLYSTEKKGLQVGIIQAARLASIGHLAPSSFVKVTLQPNTSSKWKHKTSVKKRTTNPEYNETIFFEIEQNQVAVKNLVVSVWRNHFGQKDEIIGGFQMGVSSNGKLLKHWNECAKKTDQKSEYWHALTQNVDLKH